MGFRTKASSKIRIGDQSYHWVVSPGDGSMYIIVQLDSGKGQRLEVLVDYGAPVTPEVVRDCILKALEKGWAPGVAGSLWRLSLSPQVWPPDY